MKFYRSLIIFTCIVIVSAIGLFLYNQNSNSTTSSNSSSSQSSSQNSTSCNTVSSSPKTQASGLIITDTFVCSGIGVKAGDTITIHYTGKLTDGTVFDSSVAKNKPFQTKIGVGQVIAGWDEGLIGMTVGSKRTLTIPAELGYGSIAVGSIPANSTLIFDLELLSVR